MPLHLLGKKSWNVYNADNVARVKRDEAAAQAREQEEERLMQEADAQRRLAILRGEIPPPIESSAAAEPDQNADQEHGEESRSRGHRRKRKRADEDDTEFELRLAAEASHAKRQPSELVRKPAASSAPITDGAGHIDLFGQGGFRPPPEKNEEAEREKQKKKREYEDQYTMRFSNAAGKKAPSRPWYAQTSEGQPDQQPMKDAFGNDDANRRERDSRRIASDDPLATMKRAALRVKEVKAERKRLQQDRHEELRQLRKEEKRREHHKRRGRDKHRPPSRDGSPRERNDNHKRSKKMSRESPRRRSRDE